MPASLWAGDCHDIHLNHSLDHQQLRSDFSQLAGAQMQGRRTGSDGAKKARDYIRQRFSSIGLAMVGDYAEYQQPFHYPEPDSELSGVNVLAVKTGTAIPQQYIVVSAHYDHLGMRGSKLYYGADDNALGVAVLIALAQAAQPRLSRYSVIFLATDAEELGLYGARAFLRDSGLQAQQIKLNLNLDMLAEGGMRQRLYLTHRTNKQDYSALLQNVKAQAGLCLVLGHPRGFYSASAFKVNWYKASDHAVFGKLGIDYLYLGVDTHSRYHTIEDKTEYIQRDFFTAAAETAWLLLMQLME